MALFQYLATFLGKGNDKDDDNPFIPLVRRNKVKYFIFIISMLETSN